MTEKTCGNCLFFKRFQAFQPIGTCRFNPPTVLLVGMRQPQLSSQAPIPVTDGFWAPTTDAEWCGKWEERATVASSPFPKIDLTAESIGGNA